MKKLIRILSYTGLTLIAILWLMLLYAYWVAPAMAGEYDMECSRIKAELKRYIDPAVFLCENKRDVCYIVDQAYGGGISCYKK